MLLREKVGLKPVQTLAPPGDGRAQAVDLWLFPLGEGGCSSGRRAQEPLAPFGTGTPAAAARQPAGKYAATKAPVYLFTGTDVLQRRTCLRCPSSFSSPICTLPYDGIGIAVGGCTSFQEPVSSSSPSGTQHQLHGSQRPCTWQRALQPLSVSSSLQSTFEASSLASEFSPLCGVVHFPCHRVGHGKYTLCTAGYAYLYTDMSFTFAVKWSLTQLAVEGLTVVLNFVFSSFFQVQTVVGIPKPQIIEEFVRRGMPF